MRRNEAALLAAISATVLLAAAVPAAPALAAPSIACGMTVTTDITLTRDLTCSGPGLIVGADGITIDLAGHTLTGADGGSMQNGIYAEDHRDLRIRGGTITGFRQAVALYRMRDAVLRGLRITGNTPILGAYAGTVYIEESEDIDLVDSQLLQPPNTRAAWTVISRGIRMQRVRATGSLTWVTSSGISLTRSVFTDGSINLTTSTAQVEIKRNVLRRSSVFTSEVTNVTIADNRFAGPARLAIGLTVTRNPVVERNFLTGAEAGVGTGSLVTGARITQNVFTGNGYGVRLVEPDLIGDITITDNVFTNNRNAGVFLEAARLTDTAAPLAVTRNTFVRNGHGSTDTDAAGRTINDGIHTNLPVGSLLTIADNRTYFNADHGIEALPTGSVIDGGGNQSTGDPNGCAGVTCT